MTIAELRRRLPVGTHFAVEFLGRERAERVVVKNTTHQLVSRFLSGKRAGELIYLEWRGIKASQGADGITLADESGPFVRFVL